MLTFPDLDIYQVVATNSDALLALFRSFESFRLAAKRNVNANSVTDQFIDWTDPDKFSNAIDQSLASFRKQLHNPR